MKRETFLRSAMSAVFIGFVCCFGASMTRAQNVQPYVDCVEPERDNSNALTGKNQAINAAILAGEDGFFEIGVRPGNSTGAFTTLTPRQPLTAVPLAVRAVTANTAFRAAFADESKISTYGNNGLSGCDEEAEYGRNYVDSSAGRLYICTSSGWRFIPLQTP